MPEEDEESSPKEKPQAADSSFLSELASKMSGGLKQPKTEEAKGMNIVLIVVADYMSSFCFL